VIRNKIENSKSCLIFTLDTMLTSWTNYAEANGVNKKEPVETFDWLDSDNAAYYEDCRDALTRANARETLKNYTFDEKSSGLPFCSGPLAEVKLDHGHSGSSATSILWTYRRILNDWDGWVFSVKQKKAMQDYNEKFPFNKIDSIINICKMSESDDLAESIMEEYCGQLGITGSPQEIMAFLTPIWTELNEIREKERGDQNEHDHRDLIRCLEFLYEHPFRWFDTPQGCHLNPVHPNFISDRAMNEMDAKYPGYASHIVLLKRAMQGGLNNRPRDFNPWSKEGEAYLKAIFKEYSIVPGKVK